MRLQELSVLIPEEGKIRTGRNNWEIKRLKNVSEGTINVNSAVASFRASHVFIIVLGLTGDGSRFTTYLS